MASASPEGRLNTNSYVSMEGQGMLLLLLLLLVQGPHPEGHGSDALPSAPHTGSYECEARVQQGNLDLNLPPSYP